MRFCLNIKRAIYSSPPDIISVHWNFIFQDLATLKRMKDTEKRELMAADLLAMTTYDSILNVYSF